MNTNQVNMNARLKKDLDKYLRDIAKLFYS